MVMKWLNEGYGLVLMGLACVLGVTGRLLAGSIYTSLCRQCEDMTNAKDKYLKQIKTRFESSYRLNKGGVNADAIVRKLMSRYRVKGISLYQLERMDKQAALFCVTLGLGLFSWFYPEGNQTVLAGGYFLWGFVFALGTVFLGNIAGGSDSMNQLTGCLIDYLDNILANRLEQELEQRGVNTSKGGMRDDIFMKKEETALEIRKEPMQELAKEPIIVREIPFGQRRGEEPEEETVAQLAATLEREVSGKPGPEPNGYAGNGKRGRKLSKQEEQLISDILKEYLGQE